MQFYTLGSMYRAIIVMEKNISFDFNRNVRIAVPNGPKKWYKNVRLNEWCCFLAKTETLYPGLKTLFIIFFDNI